MGVQRTWKNPIYTHFFKHTCQACGGFLKVIQVSKVVNSKSPEAKKFDFDYSSTEGGKMIGDVKFIWDEFLCPTCNIQTSIKEQQKIENEQKKMEREKERLSKQGKIN